MLVRVITVSCTSKTTFISQWFNTMKVCSLLTSLLKTGLTALLQVMTQGFRLLLSFWFAVLYDTLGVLCTSSEQSWPARKERSSRGGCHGGFRVQAWKGPLSLPVTFLWPLQGVWGMSSSVCWGHGEDTADHLAILCPNSSFSCSMLRKRWVVEGYFMFVLRSAMPHLCLCFTQFQTGERYSTMDHHSLSCWPLSAALEPSISLWWILLSWSWPQDEESLFPPVTKGTSTAWQPSNTCAKSADVGSRQWCLSRLLWWLTSTKLLKDLLVPVGLPAQRLSELRDKEL